MGKIELNNLTIQTETKAERICPPTKFLGCEKAA